MTKLCALRYGIHLQSLASVICVDIIIIILARMVSLNPNVASPMVNYLDCIIPLIGS
jgi:hypothetical protein